MLVAMFEDVTAAVRIRLGKMSTSPTEDTRFGEGPSWHTEDFDIPAYLAAMGAEHLAGAPVTVDTLAELHRAHVHTFPFANVDILLGTRYGVAPDDVQDRLVRRHRGGYCFDHAQIFAAAAEHLGFEVTRHLGRVHSEHNSRTHMTVMVRIDGERWLCDPGFGFSLNTPILVADGAESSAAGRTFTLTEAGEGASRRWSLWRDGELQHVTDKLTVWPADVVEGDLFASTHPSAPFPNHLMCMRYTDSGHVTLTETTRTDRPTGGMTSHAEIGPDDVLARPEELGISLDDSEHSQLREWIQAR